MSFRKFLGLFGGLALIFVGVWLIGQSTQPGLETSLRRNTVRQIAVSAGFSESGTVAGAEVAPSADPVAPVTVQMSEVPAGVPDPNNMYERWLAGEIDLENEAFLSDADMAALRQLALDLPPDLDIQQLNEAVAHGPGLASGLAFVSLDFNSGGNGRTPPDPEIAAGHNFVIAVVNTSFEIYDKRGNVVQAATSFASFFGGADCPAIFDPNVVFDEEHNRYAMGIDANGARYCLAVSDSENALGSWSVYSFPVGNGSSVYMDYPHLGVGQSALFMGGNIFNRSNPAAPFFVESRIWAFDKQAMYAGNPANFTTAGINDGQATPFPLNMHGWHGDWSSTHFFATDPYDGNRLTIRQWPSPLSGGLPSIVATVDVSTQMGIATGMPVDTPQSSGNLIDPNDFRSRDFEYYEGSAWWTDSISCNPGSGTVNCARWVEIDLSGGGAVYVQGGVAASNGDYRIYPNLAVNACGDMLLGYSKSNPSIFPSIYVAGREAGDPAGTLQPEILVKAGEIPYTDFHVIPRRFGDYTGMTIDPNGYEFWYLGEYSKNIPGSTKWGTYISSFTFPGCEGAMINEIFLPALMRP